MNDLIKITKSNIGAEVINSVNAREIHDYLEIKTPFSMWIKRAIEKYDFEDNQDFTTHKFVNGKATQIDYIVSFDMAKELCLVEPNEKGKETRQYFINFEKKGKVLIQQQSQEIELLQGMLNTLSKMNNRVSEIEHKIENDITLTSAQKYHLKDKVNKKAYELKNKHHFADDFMSKVFARIWKKLKKHFVVSSYMEIPKSKFDEACSIIDKIVIGDVLI